MTELSNARVLVVGLASSGLAAVEALESLGAVVRVTEERPDPSGADELRSRGVEVLTGGHAPEHLHGIELLVTSPGVFEHAAILRWAAERGLPIWSELELGWRLVRVPTVAVTGTNGKSTTTELVACMLRASGVDAIACANIGYPLSAAARGAHGALAIEASAEQLRFIETFAPRVSALLNLAPDHLDWHGSFEAYADAKARIFENQSRDEFHVANRDDERASVISKAAPCRLVWFGLGEPGEGEVGFVGDDLVARLDGEVRLGPPPRPDPTFREDAAAAAAIALAFGVQPGAVVEGMRSMRPASHRGETVATAGDVAFVDNSKATNVHAVLATMRGRDRVVLIAGGRAKGVDLAPLRQIAPALAGVVAIGEARDELMQLFDGTTQVREAGSIEEATELAFELAPERGQVLLAPACASWDMFRDYGERGDRFAEAARTIARRTETDV